MIVSEVFLRPCPEGRERHRATGRTWIRSVEEQAILSSASDATPKTKTQSRRSSSVLPFPEGERAEARLAVLDEGSEEAVLVGVAAAVPDAGAVQEDREGVDLAGKGGRVAGER